MQFLHRFWSTDRSLSVLLLFLSLVIFVIHPLNELDVVGRVVTGVFFSLLLVSGVRAVAKNRWAIVVVGSLVLANLVVRWLRLSFADGSLAFWDAFFAALFCGIMAVVVLTHVFREGAITFGRIQGAIAAYLLLGLFWAFAYQLVSLQWPAAFTAASATGVSPNEDLSSRFIYFSLVTLTTMGYGDITPVHPIARSLATMEALIGQLFPAVLLARLVSMEIYHRQAKGSERP
jgi:hypothetical protein